MTFKGKKAKKAQTCKQGPNKAKTGMGFFIFIIVDFARVHYKQLHPAIVLAIHFQRKRHLNCPSQG